MLADADGGKAGFAFAAWTREYYPGVEVLLAGSIAGAAEKAGDICKEGPALTKPYDHKQVLEHIHRLVAARDRHRRGQTRHRREGGAGDRVWDAKTKVHRSRCKLRRRSKCLKG